MRRSIALPIAVVVWFALAAFMWATLIGVNMGQVCGRVLAPWAYLAEAIVFLPTIWVTRPMDAWLELGGHGWAITVGSVIETALLATLYAGTLYLLIRRRFLAVARRLLWPVGVILITMIGASIFFRAQLEASDYGKPLQHEAEKAAPLQIRTPVIDPNRKITMTARRQLPADDQWNDVAIIAREGVAPLLIATKTTYIREPQFHSTVDYVLRRVHPDHLDEVSSIPIVGAEMPPIGEPRCAYGSASDVLVALRGRAQSFSNMPLDKPSLISQVLDLDSPETIVGPDGTYHAGFSRGEIPATAKRLAFQPTSPRAATLVVARNSDILGYAENFSDHNLNNVAFTRTSDGILHILGTEVAVSHDNSSRVHYMRFRPSTREWISDDVLMVRTKFTSTSTPRIARNGESVDAFWHADGGSNHFAEDGLYTRRIGEAETWHLLADRCEFVVVEDANGTLVAAATNPSESGVIRWFFRPAGEPRWFDLGSTDAGEKLYTLTNTGTEPFAVWREDSALHAAFNGIRHLVVIDVSVRLK